MTLKVSHHNCPMSDFMMQLMQCQRSLARLHQSNQTQEVTLATLSQGLPVLKERTRLKDLVEQNVSSNSSNQLRTEWPHIIAEVTSPHNMIAGRPSSVEDQWITWDKSPTISKGQWSPRVKPG